MPLSHKQKIEMAERDRRVIELKARGMTFEMIAKSGQVPGVNHAQSAKKCFNRGLQNRVAVAADQYRELENEKLDLAERTVIAILSDATAERRERLKAADSLINIMARRAKLNGIDAQPTDDNAAAIRTVLVSAEVLTKTIRPDDDL